MKNIIMLLLLISGTVSFAQDYNALHGKYWYYRTRLRNDFMKVGLDHGCSIPMEERGLDYAPNSTNPNYFFTTDPSSGAPAKWGDAMGELGYYIGILATEYRLLTLNNQETDSVKYELYCALEALNRMDYYAESYFTQAIANSTNPQTFSPSYDGFMLRDDVPIDFVQNNMKHFNYFGTKGFCSQVKLNRIATTSGDGAQQQGESYHPPKDGNLGYWEKHYAGSYISQDNWINCIVGLALVRKFVPSGTNYNNQSFSDGNAADMNQEAFAISLRVMNYFKADPDWMLKYPTGNFIGSRWGGIGGGLAFAHAEALNKMDQNKWGHFVQPNPLSFNTWCQYNDWRTDGNWVTVLYKNTVAIPLMYINYIMTSHASGTLGNLYTQLPLVILPNGETAYKFGQLYPSSGNPDVAVQVSNLSAVCNCEYTFRGVDTKGRLQLHINGHQIWQPELIRVALHGEGDCSTTELNQSYYSAALDLIQAAPCEGPYNWRGDDFGTIYGPNSQDPRWHTQTQLDHPESREDNGWIAEFNGIDYMFYHNLLNIIDIEKNGNSANKQMVDFGRRHITNTYPMNISGQNWGTNSNPASIKAYEYIVADNVVSTSADVSYRAGKEITLTPGFSSALNSSFSASIQHFECSEIMSNPINPSVNALVANTNNPEGQQVDPDLQATSYDHTTVTSKEPSITATKTYVPFLIKTDNQSLSTSNSLSDNMAVQIVPNPSSGISKLFLSKPEWIKSIQIADALGKPLTTFTTVSYSNEIDLSKVGKGVYNIILTGKNDEVIVKKIIIQ